MFLRFNFGVRVIVMVSLTAFVMFQNQQTRVGEESLQWQRVSLKQIPTAKLLPLHLCKSKNYVIV